MYSLTQNFWTQFKTAHLQGQLSSRQPISRPRCIMESDPVLPRLPKASLKMLCKRNRHSSGQSVSTRLSQICTFLPNNFFVVYHNFIPLFGSKALQKTENWKFLCIFSPGSSPLKFYYITLLCEMELGRKFKFFPIFHYKTILFSSESEFSMKNVIFWGTSCWCSSKI